MKFIPDKLLFFISLITKKFIVKLIPIFS